MPKFTKTNRVLLPGDTWRGTQAVILDVTEAVEGCPVYAVAWLSLAGEPMQGSVGETDLLLAGNMPPNITPVPNPKSKPKHNRKRR